MKATTARTRLLVALLTGVLVFAVCLALRAGKFTPLIVWDSTAIVYGTWTWLVVLPLTAAQAKSHALSENPGRVAADVLLLVASVSSLVAVALLIIDASSASGLQKLTDVGLGLVSIVISWTMVHTIFTLKYARQFYGLPEGGMNFNDAKPPAYSDFAYLAFTIGMTFQVSDTVLQTKQIRSTALKHALLAYLFGTVIIATTINTLASLSK